MEKDFETKTESSAVERPPLSNNMSRVVSDIVWARQLSAKVTSNFKVAQSLFSDLKAMDNLTSICKEFIDDIKAYEKK